MNKAIVFMYLAIIMLMSFSACGQKYDDESLFRIDLIEGGKAVRITEYVGNSQTVRIPPRIQKLPVKEIGRSAFEDEQIVLVTIPRTVTNIGENAFAQNRLVNIDLPKNVTNISYGAFRDNKITSVNLPKSIITIGAEAFSGNEFTTVYIPRSVTKIGEHAFTVEILYTITIGANVEVGVSRWWSSVWDSFAEAYIANNLAGGTYVFENNRWVLSKI